MARISATPTTTAVFALVHAIIFKAPFTRVKVEVDAAAPWASARAEIAFAKPTGAAWTELTEIVSAILVVVEVTPRLKKNFCNFQKIFLIKVFCQKSRLKN